MSDPTSERLAFEQGALTERLDDANRRLDAARMRERHAHERGDHDELAHVRAPAVLAEQRAASRALADHLDLRRAARPRTAR